MKAPTNTIAVVVNPAGAAAEAEALRAELRERNIDVTWLETTEDDPGVGQARHAVESEAGLVVACGGDGTVRACIESVAGTGVTLAIIPAGTGNLLARNLGIPTDVAEALECALSASTRTIDVGHANGEAFAVMSGVGIDGAIMNDTSREAKNRFGALAYVATAVRHLRDRGFTFRAFLKGQPAHWGRARTVLVGNMGGLQGGVDLFPDADPADEALDVLAIRPQSLWGWVRAGIAVLRGTTHSRDVDRWTARSGTIELTSPQPFQLDGEERPPVSRVDFRVEPGALTVCVPEEKT